MQEPGPRLDVVADTGREAVELALQPLVQRRGPVVVEDADVDVDFTPLRELDLTAAGLDQAA
ncbi:hypothetical protein ACIOHC_39170 [Streptomyces sp. NPDC088252]|uniref:hypothetical protein n=1 Tax=Streptomyces sp. NPDC088252 TaxID=3365845 RepID=UPI003828FD64